MGAPTVNSSRTLTLFAPPPPIRTGPSSFLVSVVTHGVVLVLMFLAISHAPRIAEQSLAQRYTVRLLQLHRPEPRLRWSPGSGGGRPQTQALARAARSGGQSSAPSAPRQLAQLSTATHTLLQPDAPLTPPLLRVTTGPRRGYVDTGKGSHAADRAAAAAKTGHSPGAAYLYATKSRTEDLRYPALFEHIQHRDTCACRQHDYADRDATARLGQGAGNGVKIRRAANAGNRRVGFRCSCSRGYDRVAAGQSDRLRSSF